MTPAAALKSYMETLKKHLSFCDVFNGSDQKVQSISIRPPKIVYENGREVRLSSVNYFSVAGVWIDFKHFYLIEREINKTRKLVKLEEKDQ